MQAATPYLDQGRYIFWQAGIALVFIWDNQALAQAMAQHGLRPTRTRILPETVLRPTHDHGALLLKALQGYEGQVWQSGQLVLSRYWKDIPGQQAWLLMQRDAGLAPEHQQTEVPAPRPTTLNASPWQQARSLKFELGDPWRNERLVYLAAAACLTFYGTWHYSQIYRLEQQHAALQADYAALDQQAGPIALARGQALNALANIERLVRADPYPQQMQLMAWVAEKLLKKGDRITEWDYQSGQLKFTISTKIAQKSKDLVEVLHNAGLFTNIRSATGKTPETITLDMTVRKVGEQSTIETDDRPASPGT